MEQELLPLYEDVQGVPLMMQYPTITPKLSHCS